MQSKLSKWLIAGITFLAVLIGAKYLGILAPNPIRLPDDRPASGRCMLWFVGSSSIHRWSTLDTDMQPWAAHNRGMEGATLDEIVPLFAKASPSEGRPVAIILYAGENDIALGQDHRAVLRNLARFAIAKNRLYQDTPLFVLSMKPSPGRVANFSEQQRYNAAARLLAPRLPDTSYVDITTPLLKDGMPRTHYQADGIHMTPAGYAIWAKVVRGALDRTLPPSVLRGCGERR